jgi:Clp protease
MIPAIDPCADPQNRAIFDVCLTGQESARATRTSSLNQWLQLQPVSWMIPPLSARKTRQRSPWVGAVVKRGERPEPQSFLRHGESKLQSLRRSRVGAMTNNIQKQIWSERGQYPATRKTTIQAVEKGLGGRTLVTFFTSFNHVVEIDSDDCDMLQSVLQHIDLNKGLALMIDSPGGDGLAAELIVNTCRAYSGTGDYWAIVPGSAKSAASIICMGAINQSISKYTFTRRI